MCSQCDENEVHVARLPRQAIMCPLLGTEHRRRVMSGRQGQLFQLYTPD